MTISTRRVDPGRRRFLTAGAATAAMGLTGALSFPALAQEPRRLKIGYVSPATGPLAAFFNTRLAVPLRVFGCPW